MFGSFEILPYRLACLFSHFLLQIIFIRGIHDDTDTIHLSKNESKRWQESDARRQLAASEVRVLGKIIVPVCRALPLNSNSSWYRHQGTHRTNVGTVGVAFGLRIVLDEEDVDILPKELVEPKLVKASVVVLPH
jgi:hypothetical protein